MDKNKSCLANFVQTFVLTTIKTEGGTISAIGSECGTSGCTGTYDAGTSVVLTAMPATGFKFVNWSGDCNGTVPTVTVVMNSPKTCTATFIKKVEEVSPCATDDDSCQIMGPLNILNSPTPNFFPTTYQNAYFAGEVSIDSSILDPKTPGGITLRGDDFTNPKSEKMVIGANITVAPDDVKKATTTGIDILVLVNYTLYTDDTHGYNIWYMLEEKDYLSSLLSYPFFGEEWHGELSKEQPVALFPHVGVDKLSGTKPYGFEIFSVNLPFYNYIMGTYDIYVGYRLTGEDRIIYGRKPIQFKIE
jgi:hypothetical protein